jgi:hypothetical protein
MKKWWNDKKEVIFCAVFTASLLVLSGCGGGGGGNAAAPIAPPAPIINTSDVAGTYYGTISTDDQTIYGTYGATLTLNSTSGGSLSVSGAGSYYSNTVTVSQADSASITISFKDADGDTIVSVLSRSNNNLHGSWRYTAPQYDAVGVINVSKSAGN